MNLLDFFFPRRCVYCGKLGKYFCEDCYGKIRFIEEPFCVVCKKPAIDGMTHPRCRTIYSLDGIYAAVHFHEPVKIAIHKLKYQFVSDLCPNLSEILLKNFPNPKPQFDFLLAVPLYKLRENERGFNQSRLLALNISKAINVPFLDGILEKVKQTKAQADLNSKERRENVKNVYVCKNTIEVKGKTIGLVDDVSTTGSTLSECAKVLKKSGAKSVFGIVLAHG